MTTRRDKPADRSALTERLAGDLRRVAQWALRSAAQLDAVPSFDDEPLYATETGDPLNLPARLESQLTLLRDEYLVPARRQMARISATLRLGSPPPDHSTTPADKLEDHEITTISMSFPRDGLVDLYARFAVAVGREFGVDVEPAFEGRELILVVLADGAERERVRQCIALLIDPWTASQVES
ncbi:MAG: hypothetical protein AAGC60_23560 [Acidobacteriota bacterium]